MKILHVLISKGFAGSELYAINLLNHQSQNHQTFLIKNSKSDANKYNKFLNINVKTYDLNGFFKKIKINKIIGVNEESTSEIKKSNLEIKNFFSKLGIFLLE